MRYSWLGAKVPTSVSDEARDKIIGRAGIKPGAALFVYGDEQYHRTTADEPLPATIRLLLSRKCYPIGNYSRQKRSFYRQRKKPKGQPENGQGVRPSTSLFFPILQTNHYGSEGWDFEPRRVYHSFSMRWMPLRA